MLTDKQKETFRKLKAGELTASEKADFYYRLSVILKKDLEGLKDLSRLLDEIPESYLRKIDFQEAAVSSMELTEKLVKRLDPSPYESMDKDGKFHIVRHFRVDMSGMLPGVTGATPSIDVVYEATKEEVQFFNRLHYHVILLKEMWENNQRPNEILTPEEMQKRIVSIVNGRPYTANAVGMVASPTEETAKNIMEGKPLGECGLPDFQDIDLKKAGLRNSRKEEPK